LLVERLVGEMETMVVAEVPVVLEPVLAQP